MSEDRAPATGKETAVPVPDPIARDYILLSLRLGKLLPGIVDSYFGPADLKAQVEAEAPLTASKLREMASSFESRLTREVVEPDRVRWLKAQMVAFEAQALMLAGDPLPYEDYITCLFDVTPVQIPEAVFDAAADDLARLLPSGELRTETVADRLAVWDSHFTIDEDRVPALAQWVVTQVRERADRLVGLPSGESIDFEFVSGGPWSAFNQYEGAGRSSIEVNTAALRRPADLIHMAAHECYPGRHTERAWKERRLVGEMHRLEATVALLNTPEALIGEGLAYLGERMVVPDDVMVDLLVELYGRGGLELASDPAAAREAAEKQVRIQRALAGLRGVTSNAAFLFHAGGASRDDVAAYLSRYLLTSLEKAEKRMASLTDPILRAQVIAGSEGERLIRRWFELGRASEQADLFGRLLREQLTPGSLSAELSSGGHGEAGW
ncbi:MAG TPA: hypothetical protein VF337_02120 [Candidatus Limnocylindrales bacterium]